MNRKHWWIGITALAVLGAVGFGYIGIETYRTAPPLPSFTDSAGSVVIPRATILRGQQLFQRYALMNYGSIFGDGAGRGPDFTADALHETARTMHTTYVSEGGAATEWTDAAASVRVKADLKRNTYNPARNTVSLSTGQVAAVRALPAHYASLFSRSPDVDAPSVDAAVTISDPAEIEALSAFFFWSAWVSSAQRPGFDYSYTHNWPYEPIAGNVPSGPVTFWSVLGLFALVLGLGAVLFSRGRLELRLRKEDGDESRPLCTTQLTDSYAPTPTQRATYKFFAVAAVLFLL